LTNTATEWYSAMIASNAQNNSGRIQSPRLRTQTEKALGSRSRWSVAGTVADLWDLSLLKVSATTALWNRIEAQSSKKTTTKKMDRMKRSRSETRQHLKAGWLPAIPVSEPKSRALVAAHVPDALSEEICARMFNEAHEAEDS